MLEKFISEKLAGFVFFVGSLKNIITNSISSLPFQIVYFFKSVLFSHVFRNLPISSNLSNYFAYNSIHFAYISFIICYFCKIGNTLSSFAYNFVKLSFLSLISWSI